MKRWLDTRIDWFTRRNIVCSRLDLIWAVGAYFILPAVVIWRKL